MTDHAERNIIARTELMGVLLAELRGQYDRAIDAGATPEALRTELQRRTDLLRAMATGGGPTT